MMPNQTEPDVLSQVSHFIGTYLQCSEHQRTILALWVLHTYCFYTARVTPYLSIRSAHKQSGKTLCLQLLNLLCEGSALTSGGLKASDLAVPTQAKPITALLLDECHATIGTRSRSKAPTLRALFDGSFHLLHGHNNIRQERNAFCPKAFTGLGPLPEDLADRSLPIILEPLDNHVAQSCEPKTGNNRVAQPPSAVSEGSGVDPLLPMACNLSPIPAGSTPSCSLSPVTCSLPDRFHIKQAIHQVQPIRNRLNHLADVHLLPLLDTLAPLPRSAFPPNLSPRQQDIVEPLLLLAGLIGGPWPVRALKAFAIIFDLETHFDLLPNIQLLADVRDCFAYHNNPERLSTDNLVEWMNDKDGAFTAHTLARLLRPFAIYPRNQRINESQGKGEGKSKSKVKSKSKSKSKSKDKDKSNPARGYRLADFEKAWKQYLDLEISVESAGLKAEATSRQIEALASQIANIHAVCNGVSLAQACVAQPIEPQTGNSRVAQPPSAVSETNGMGVDPLPQVPAGRGSPMIGASNQKSEIENLKSFITCSPECELEARRRRSSQGVSAPGDSLANLSIQEIRQREEALTRELFPEISNPNSKIVNKDAVCNGVSLAHARVAQPVEPQTGNSRVAPPPSAVTDVDGVELPSAVRKCAGGTPDGVDGLSSTDPMTRACPRLPRLAVGGELAQPKEPDEPMKRQVLLERLQALRHHLCLKGNLNIPSMAESYQPAALQARLDWVNANPGWCDVMHGIFASDFIHAFARINVNNHW